jgi:RNA polymerase sigma-70 factor (ECF subfamily)
MNLEERKRLLESAIAALPRNYRAVYLLREVQQLSTAETAACLHISADSAKVLLHRARERLKIELLKSAAGAELFSYPATFCDPLTRRVMAKITQDQCLSARA